MNSHVLSCCIDKTDYSEVKLLLASKAAYQLNVTPVRKNQKTQIILRLSGWRIAVHVNATKIQIIIHKFLPMGFHLVLVTNISKYMCHIVFVHCRSETLLQLVADVDTWPVLSRAATSHTQLQSSNQPPLEFGIIWILAWALILNLSLSAEKMIVRKQDKSSCILAFNADMS